MLLTLLGIQIKPIYKHETNKREKKIKSKIKIEFIYANKREKKREKIL